MSDMAGLQSIENKILADADAECAGIADEAKAEVNRILAENARNIAAYGKQLADKNSAEIGSMKQVSASTASLAVRKELLAAKRQLLDEAFKLAVNKLENSDAEKYSALMLELLSRCSVNGGETVRMAVKAEELLGAGFVSKMSEACGKKLVRGEPEPSIGGGFVLCGDGSRQICSFAAAVEVVHDDVEPEIAEILFR